MREPAFRIQAVLFDLDNTLCDRDAAFLAFCTELYRTCAAMQRANIRSLGLDGMAGVMASRR